MTRDIYLDYFDSIQARADQEMKYERVLLILRRELIRRDPTLPSEFDGTAWAEVEAEWENNDL